MVRLRRTTILAVIGIVLSLTGCTDEDFASDSYENGNYEYETKDYNDDDYDDDDDETYDEEREDWKDESDERQSSGAGLFQGLGSADELEGRTLIVSIYADDTSTKWKKSDQSMKYDFEDYLGVATKWITKQAKGYGCKAEFIYDWELNSNLYYEGKVDGKLTEDDEDMDYVAWDYIENNIDSKALLDEYSADNMIYMFFLNTDEENEVTSCTRNYYEGMEYPYEICYIYANTDGERENPASIAHEILHAFGAPDLYSADEDGYNYGITRKFVKKMEKEGSNDIMFTTFDVETDEAHYDRISNEFTELDAYYTGLTDYSKVVEEWGFEKSQH